MKKRGRGKRSKAQQQTRRKKKKKNVGGAERLTAPALYEKFRVGLEPRPGQGVSRPSLGSLYAHPSLARESGSR